MTILALYHYLNAQNLHWKKEIEDQFYRLYNCYAAAHFNNNMRNIKGIWYFKM